MKNKARILTQQPKKGSLKNIFWGSNLVHNHTIEEEERGCPLLRIQLSKTIQKKLRFALGEVIEHLVWKKSGDMHSFEQDDQMRDKFIAIRIIQSRKR